MLVWKVRTCKKHLFLLQLFSCNKKSKTQIGFRILVWFFFSWQEECCMGILFCWQYDTLVIPQPISYSFKTFSEKYKLWFWKCFEEWREVCEEIDKKLLFLDTLSNIWLIYHSVHAFCVKNVFMILDTPYMYVNKRNKTKQLQQNLKQQDWQQ